MTEWCHASPTSSHNSQMHSVITATGSHIPSVRVPNEHFLGHDFRGADQKTIDKSNADILKQFESITTIRERRYVPDDLDTSDIAFDAARKALQSSNIDPEQLDGIIVAHNFGDVRAGSQRLDLVPSLAARVKAKLEIRNPFCPAWDLIFGCPGWLQGVIVADQMIRAGDAHRVMVIGADTLSRISDPLDRAGVHLRDVKKVLIHQANGKMDEAILDAVYDLYDAGTPSPDVMPMTISWLGNSSVATIPTLLDLLVRGELEGHAIHAGDIIVFASVAAGMHINAVVYRWV